MRPVHVLNLVFTAFTTVVAVLNGADASAITVSPPPTRQYVSQAWVGFSTDDTYTIRINLSPDGTGAGVLVAGDEAPEQFDVTTWTLTDRALDLSVRFHNPARSVSRITGSFKVYLTSYISGMLPHPERIGASWLPGPLELSMGDGENPVRFGAWPEHELRKLLRLAKKASR